MTPIATIPTPDLLADLDASRVDIALCRYALRQGVTEHTDGLPVAERLRVNQGIVARIEAELERRAEPMGATVR